MELINLVNILLTVSLFFYVYKFWIIVNLLVTRSISCWFNWL